MNARTGDDTKRPFVLFVPPTQHEITQMVVEGIDRDARLRRVG